MNLDDAEMHVRKTQKRHWLLLRSSDGRALICFGTWYQAVIDLRQVTAAEGGDWFLRPATRKEVQAVKNGEPVTREIDFGDLDARDPNGETP